MNESRGFGLSSTSVTVKNRFFPPYPSQEPLRSLVLDELVRVIHHHEAQHQCQVSSYKLFLSTHIFFTQTIYMYFEKKKTLIPRGLEYGMAWQKYGRDMIYGCS